MIKLLNITKGYGSETLFEDISLSLDSSERTGLIGRNGYGKTTLFRIIAGDEEPDSGEVHLPKNYTIGYLK
ncbi:MAG: ABC-F family ATP-binding cassette domain-containing protein, partial [Actinomycetia bacterium]|nr:ABC-F family ATP-binding cassette domain-containing protein [Actinomycetes bacterium]